MGGGGCDLLLRLLLHSTFAPCRALPDCANPHEGTIALSPFGGVLERGLLHMLACIQCQGMADYAIIGFVDL